LVGREKKWTLEDDEILYNSVVKYGDKKWQLVANFLPGRNFKQCRERWMFHVDPSIDRSPLSPEEIKKIKQLFLEHGTDWISIAKYLPGRTTLQIKNWWNANLRRNTSRRSVYEKKGRTKTKRKEFLLKEPFSDFNTLVFIAEQCYLYEKTQAISAP
jgi:hypothetical protein